MKLCGTMSVSAGGLLVVVVPTVVVVHVIWSETPALLLLGLGLVLPLLRYNEPGSLFLPTATPSPIIAIPL